MQLTQQQRDILHLLMRSPDSGDGWRMCSPIVFEKVIVPMSDELVEKDTDQKRVRLTEEGKTVFKWM